MLSDFSLFSQSGLNNLITSVSVCGDGFVIFLWLEGVEEGHKMYDSSETR